MVLRDELCEFVGFCNSAFKFSILLGYGTVSLGVWCPTFCDCLVVLAVKVFCLMFTGPPCCHDMSGTFHPLMCCSILEEWRAEANTLVMLLNFYTVLRFVIAECWLQVKNQLQRTGSSVWMV